MGLLDQKYKDQRLTDSQKKKIKPAIQGGGPNYLGKQEEVTVPKKWLSDPDHVVAELAYITPEEKKILLEKNLYGSLKGKPNTGPAGIQSLQGDMGGFGGTGGGGGGSGGGGGDGGGRESYGGGGQYKGGSSSNSSSSNNGGGNNRESYGSSGQYGNTVSAPSPGDTGGEGGYAPKDKSDTQFGETSPGRDPSKQYEVKTELTKEQKKTLDKQRQQAQYAISPSTDPKNKVIGGLLSTVLFPGAGTLYGMYLDATALGYPMSNPFSGIFGNDNITENTIQDFKDRGGGGGNEGMQLIQNVLKIVNPDMPESVAQKYYDAIPQTEKTELSFQARYNNMKNNVNGILNSPSPVGLLAVNESPFYDFLKTRGLDRRIL